MPPLENAERINGLVSLAFIDDALSKAIRKRDAFFMASNLRVPLRTSKAEENVPVEVYDRRRCPEHVADETDSKYFYGRT